MRAQALVSNSYSCGALCRAKLANAIVCLPWQSWSQSVLQQEAKRRGQTQRIASHSSRSTFPFTLIKSTETRFPQSSLSFLFKIMADFKTYSYGIRSSKNTCLLASLTCIVGHAGVLATVQARHRNTTFLLSSSTSNFRPQIFFN